MIYWFHSGQGCSIDASVHFIMQLEKDYDIDLMDKLITSSAEKSSTHKDGKCKVSHRVIVDHLRSSWRPLTLMAP